VKARDVMTTTVVTVAPQTPYKEVVEQLVRPDVSSVPVVDADAGLLGLITEADFISKEAYGHRRARGLAMLADLLSARDHHWVTKATGWVAGDIMTKGVEVCAPHDDLRVLARRMLSTGVKRMPVVDESRLVGMVSRHDVLKLFDRPDADVAAGWRRGSPTRFRWPMTLTSPDRSIRAGHRHRRRAVRVGRADCRRRGAECRGCHRRRQPPPSPRAQRTAVGSHPSLRCSMTDGVPGQASLESRADAWPHG